MAVLGGKEFPVALPLHVLNHTVLTADCNKELSKPPIAMLKQDFLFLAARISWISDNKERLSHGYNVQVSKDRHIAKTSSGGLGNHCITPSVLSRLRDSVEYLVAMMVGSLPSFNLSTHLERFMQYFRANTFIGRTRQHTTLGSSCLVLTIGSVESFHIFISHLP
ncbi:hypothetical protein OUZ56_006530 [Daphnia magna]|uniref:Uncharacterized protein n=1 Tax=Daphnia magna TaxID=35525 RepID=A0ABQ9YVY4_9CRUS|nr:hypothetical protein OUZ56_006530 [Daphnia magna]